MHKELLFTIVSLFLLTTNTLGQVSQSKVVRLMGCKFTISATATNKAIAWEAINVGIEEITRIERLISSWDPNSQTSMIIRNAGVKAVKVDQELLQLILRSNKISNLTNGAFDITFASMERIYTFDGKERTLPERSTINQAREHIGYQKIEVDEEASTVFMTQKGMKMGFGAIGKGYAANRAKKIMQGINGVLGGIVNASGDLAIWGTKATGNNLWTIKIIDPKDPNKIMAELDVSNTAVVTSGDYEKYFISEGKRYGHTIDPMTGIPATGLKSVTIICKDAEVADGLATAVTVLGMEGGLYLVNQLQGVEALLLSDDDELITSDNITLNYN